MGPSPLLHPADLVRAPEEVAVAVLTEPAALTGGLAGLATRRLRAITLAVGGAPIRDKKPPATTALPTARCSAHREPEAPRCRTGRNGRRRRRRKPQPKKEEELGPGRAGRKRPQENGISNRHNHPTFIPPLTLILPLGLETMPEGIANADESTKPLGGGLGPAGEEDQRVAFASGQAPVDHSQAPRPHTPAPSPA